jgi:Xaa-Pro aminopeptidase
MRDASLDALLVTCLPNIRYLCGFSGTAGALLLIGSRTILVVDFRYATAARLLPAARGERPDVTVVLVEHGYDETITALLKEGGVLRIGIEAASLPVARFNKLSALLAGGPRQAHGANSGPQLVPTERLIERARAVKDVTEIAALREAARRLSGVAVAVPQLVRTGRREREIAWDVEAELRAAGFERPAFDTIVAAGPNSALPHARPTDRSLQPGDGVVLDFGGVYDGYCVDLTRTVQLGPVSSELRRIFNVVVQAQAAAIAAVRPGARPSDVDRAAREVLARHGLAEAFGHGTGHGLGLEVHEEPRIGKVVPGQPDDPLEQGMVFTIEPGAYIPGIGGVRLEDDVLVIDGGCEVLTDVPIRL